jgi:RNA polymerase sigma-70 factor, ECF subfamily
MNELVGPWPGMLVSADDAGGTEIAELLKAAAPLAFRVAYGVLRRRQDAEDVAQEALAKAFQSQGTLRDRDRFEAWLVRITWRRALDRRRSEVRRERREQAALGARATATVEDLALSREMEDRIWTEVDRLPEKLRMVVIMAAIEGHDMAEVSRLLDVPVGTVKSRLFHARRALAERLRWTASATKPR